MKHIIIGLIVSLLALTACENRDDVFKNNNTAPIILLADNEQMTGANDTLQASMRYGQSLTLYYEYNDNYAVKDSLLFGVMIHEGKQQSIVAKRIAHTNKICIENLQPSTTLTDSITKATIYIGLEDYYHVRGSAWIQLRVHANEPPIPTFSIHQRMPREYRISAQATTDPENDEIVAYEYVIGSQSADELVYNKAGYETADFNVYVPNANAGRAAKGGTYIIATPIQDINHVFQSEGMYSVSVRAKDKIGLWSKWYTQIIEVE